jgi:predicted CoA-substrate-specific enzyme activase
MITLGVDIGSVSTKAVILNQESEILSYNIILTSGDSRGAAEEVFNKTIKEAKVSKKDIDYVVSTGYGRGNIPFSQQQVTEITCHALGAHFLFPETGTILDVGGQDSKAINIDNKGQVLDFAMNDKCAAGTGRFLEVMAQAMGVELNDLNSLSRDAAASVLISSMCTVFAESEVVSLVAEGRPKADIIRGVYEAIAERSITLLHRVNIIKPVTMTGGVAKNKGVVDALENKLNLNVNIAEEPQIIGALGAALIAQRFMQKNS